MRRCAGIGVAARDRPVACYVAAIAGPVGRGRPHVGRERHPDSIRQRFNRLAVAAGLPRITFHDLRHSYATGALRAGISPKIVSERIGHANIGFFLETYAHVLENDDREAAEQAASFLLGDAWESDN